MSLQKSIIFNIYTLFFITSCVAFPFGISPLKMKMMNCRSMDCHSLMDCEGLKTGGSLCVFHAKSILDDPLDEWFFFSGGAIRLEAMPHSMVSVGDFKIAPSEKWLAITSVGEGHPIVDVIVLADALADKATTALRTINPYPGYINIKYWVANDSLLIESNKDLTKPDDTSESTLSDEAIPFILHVPSGEIKPYKQ